MEKRRSKKLNYSKANIELSKMLIKSDEIIEKSRKRKEDFTRNRKVTLDILSKKNINVTVLLIMDKNKSKLTKTDIDKFNSEYPSLEIKYTNIFHDRFIILDKKELYHLGASLKDLGKKVFGITKIDDINYLNLLIDMI